jgi:hypothetical protein
MKGYLQRQFVLLIGALLLASCSLSPASTSVSPTATSNLTPTYISGFADIPAGKYLFVENWNESDAQETIDRACQFELIDFPHYEFNMQTRRLSSSFTWEQVKTQNVKGFWGQGKSLQGRAGSGIYSYLEPIFALPHHAGPAVTINGVKTDGTIVVEIDGHIETLKPNASYIKTETFQEPPGCHKLITLRFTNYGLLERSQIFLN